MMMFRGSLLFSSLVGFAVEATDSGFYDVSTGAAIGGSTATDGGTATATTTTTTTISTATTTATSDATIPLTETFIRSFDGSENARAAPNAELIRLTHKNFYPDGQGLDGSGVDDNTVPNARLISNAVANPDTLTSPPEKSRASDMLWQWGQFISNDMSYTPPAVSTNQHEFTVTSPDCTTDEICTIIMNRAHSHMNESTNIREQLNEVTGFLDASTVYGHSTTRANALRDSSTTTTSPGGNNNNNNNKGLLLLTDQGLLPPSLPGNANADFPDHLHDNARDQFTAGDVRANEHVGLLAMHTLWVREHNRRAQQLATAFPNNNNNDDEDRLFHLARKIVIAEIQAITYKEFLPILIGTHMAPKLDDYVEWKPEVDPGIANEFSACAFRVGHTFLSEEVLLVEPKEIEGENGISKPLVDLYYTPGTVVEEPLLLDYILIGQTQQAANAADTKIISAVRNNLFGSPSPAVNGVGRDLVVMNIMRGRDHGLARYNTMRSELGLSTKNSFDEVTSNKEIAQELSKAYSGDIDLCDAWICGLAEDAIVDGDGELGELFSYIIANQFQRTMDGDKFFYLGDPDVHDNEALRNIGIDVDSITLADIINANTIGGVVGPNAMLA